MCNLDSLAPNALNHADGVIKNFVKITKECWTKRLTQGLEVEELDYPDKVLMYDVLDDKHKKAYMGSWKRNPRGDFKTLR